METASQQLRVEGEVSAHEDTVRSPPHSPAAHPARSGHLAHCRLLTMVVLLSAWFLLCKMGSVCCGFWFGVSFLPGNISRDFEHHGWPLAARGRGSAPSASPASQKTSLGTMSKQDTVPWSLGKLGWWGAQLRPRALWPKIW